MNSEEIGRKGRPFGGLAIITLKSFNFMIKPINTNSTRILAIEIIRKDIKIFTVNVYFPTDGGSLYSYIEVRDILNVIFNNC